jgi:hypothetical protein
MSLYCICTKSICLIQGWAKNCIEISKYFQSWSETGDVHTFHSKRVTLQTRQAGNSDRSVTKLYLIFYGSFSVRIKILLWSQLVFVQELHAACKLSFAHSWSMLRLVTLRSEMLCKSRSLYKAYQLVSVLLTGLEIPGEKL